LDSNQGHSTQVHRDRFRNLHNYKYKKQVVVAVVVGEVVELGN
jgi:hypothetical protein